METIDQILRLGPMSLSTVAAIFADLGRADGPELVLRGLDEGRWILGDDMKLTTLGGEK